MKNYFNKERNLTMLMDFYELTMSNSYFKRGLTNTKVVFDLFYRKNPDNGGYVVCTGLEQMIEYLLDMKFTSADIKYLRSKNIFDEDFLSYLSTFKFKGTIDAVPEGTIVYPNTPLVRVTGNIIEASLIETMALLCINHQSLIATKASRICRDKIVMEFGSRRAHGADAAILGARAAYIGGAVGTACAMADIKFGIPAIGTMAHSYVTFFPNEYTAFKNYAEDYPDNCTLLVDTYDVIESGIPNAIKVQKEILDPMGKKMKGVRLDSGDLAYLSKKVRKMLDDAGMDYCHIVVSNSIDEFLMKSLDEQDAKIDSYGVGERLITSKSEPVFGGVYKLVAVEDKNGIFQPRIKISENIEKITNPAKKMLWRLYSKEDGHSICDVLTLDTEIIDSNVPYECIDPNKPWKKIIIKNFVAKKMLVNYIKNGKSTQILPSINEIRDYVAQQLTYEVWETEQRFYNPHIHYVNMSKSLYELKLSMLDK